MAKQISNPLDVDMASLMREQTGQVQPRKQTDTQKSKKEDNSYRHCSFICSAELWDKLQAIARKENFTIREVMEHWIKNGIDSYETKNGKVKVKAKQSTKDIL